METKIQEKTTDVVISIFNIYYMENCLQYCIDADLYQYTNINLQKATTFFHFPDATRKELQPPNLVYQPLIEGNFNPLIKTPASTGKKILLPY